MKQGLVRGMPYVVSVIRLSHYPGFVRELRLRMVTGLGAHMSAILPGDGTILKIGSWVASSYTINVS